MSSAVSEGWGRDGWKHEFRYGKLEDIFARLYSELCKSVIGWSLLKQKGV